MSALNLAAATRIGNDLVRDALWYDDRCNWISSVTRDPGRQPGTTFGTLGPTIYEGSAGVAWFLGHLYRVTGDARFRKTARGAIRHSLRGSDGQSRSLALSLYRGALGIVLLALDLSHHVDDNAIRAEAIRLLQRVMSNIPAITYVDLLSGTAGAIAALLIVSGQLKDESLTAFALKLGDRIIRRADRSRSGYSWRSHPRVSRQNSCGLSHGASGIAYALLELFSVTGERRFLEAAERAFDYERSWFDRGRQNWTEFSWCNGVTGIALSRLRAREITGEERYTTEARFAIQATRSALEESLQSVPEVSLCHGIAGNASILHEAMLRSEEFRDAETEALVRRAARESRRQIDQARSVSLFLGTSGAGYFNLQLHDSTLPSILMPRREDFVRSPSATKASGNVVGNAPARMRDRN